MGADATHQQVVAVEQQAGQRVDGAPEAQVAQHGDVQVLNAAQLALDGEGVEQGLRGVLADTVASVELNRALILKKNFMSGLLWTEQFLKM